MGLGRAHLGDRVIHSRRRLRPLRHAGDIRSGCHRVGDGLHLAPRLDWAETIGVPRIVAVIVTATIALLILLAIIGLLSTPFAYWIGRTEELASLIKEKLQLLGQPLAIFDEIGRALAEISGAPASVAAPNYDSSTIVRGIISTLTPVVTEFMLFFFAMIFWMLYANDVKAGIAYLFSGARARQVARAVLDEAESNVSQYFGTLAIVNLCLAVLATGLALGRGFIQSAALGCPGRNAELHSLSRSGGDGGDIFRDWPHDPADAERCPRPAASLDLHHDPGGAIHYAHDYWAPPHAEPISRFLVDCFLGLDVGADWCPARSPTAHFRRCCAAPSFGAPRC
jgi:hypothetical protein